MCEKRVCVKFRTEKRQNNDRKKKVEISRERCALYFPKRATREKKTAALLSRTLSLLQGASGRDGARAIFRVCASRGQRRALRGRKVSAETHISRGKRTLSSFEKIQAPFDDRGPQKASSSLSLSRHVLDRERERERERKRERELQRAKSLGLVWGALEVSLCSSVLKTDSSMDRVCHSLIRTRRTLCDPHKAHTHTQARRFWPRLLGANSSRPDESNLGGVVTFPKSMERFVGFLATRSF